MSMNTKLLFAASFLYGVIAQPQPLPFAAQSAKGVVHFYTHSNNCNSLEDHEDPTTSFKTRMVQEKCYNIPSFLSYKPWQSHQVEEYATCSLDTFPEENCGGEVMDSVNLPLTEDKAACLDAVRSHGQDGPEGSKSARFNCEYFPPPGYQAPSNPVEHNRPRKGHHKRPSTGAAKDKE